MTTTPLPPQDAFAQAIFEGALIGLLLVDERGQIERSNPQASRILGIPQEKLTTVASLLPESMREAHEHQMRAIFDEKSARRMGDRLIEFMHPDRGRRLLDISLTPLVIEERCLVLAQISDVTGAHELSRLHQRLAAIVENSIDAIVSTDLDGRIESWNRGAELLFGYTAEEIVGQTAGVLLPAGASTEQQQHLRVEALRSPLQRLELVRRHKDGRPVEVSASLFPIVGSRNEPQGLAAVVRDISEAKRVERELRHSRTRLQLAAKAAEIGVWSLDFETNTLQCDERMKEIYGLRGDGVLTRETFREFMHPDDQDNVQRLFQGSLRDGSPFEVQHRICLPGGNTRYIQSAAVVEYAPSGKPLRFVGINRDITKDVLQQRELLAVKDRYEQLFANAPDAHLVMSLDQGKIIECNRSAELILKRSREEILGQTPIDLSPPYQPCGRPSAELVAEKIASVSLGESLRFEWVHCQADGTEFWVEVNASLIELEQRKVIAVVWRDINERKESLRLQQLLAAIVEGSTDAILSKTLDGRITSWNRGAELLFGYTAEETIGKTVVELLAPGHLAEEQELLQRVQRGEAIEPFDTVRRSKDGREIHVSMQVSPIRDERGRVAKASTILRDITRAHLAAVELKRSNLELEQFAYVASHDLQEPLRMVANYTELLAERYRGKLDEKADKYIHYASDGARRMQVLVADLLAYSRVGSQGKSLVPVNTNQTLKHVLTSLGEGIKESQASIQCEDLPPVMADETQLFQLFQNLVHNALKFRREEPPEVSIRAASCGEFWEFSVSDNGIGFDMRYAERIFQMFQRLHERGKFSGSGIGLAIVRRIVERHGGTIGVESRPQQGTTFRFTLKKAGEIR